MYTQTQASPAWLCCHITCAVVKKNSNVKYQEMIYESKTELIVFNWRVCSFVNVLINGADELWYCLKEDSQVGESAEWKEGISVNKLDLVSAQVSVERWQNKHTQAEHIQMALGKDVEFRSSLLWVPLLCVIVKLLLFKCRHNVQANLAITAGCLFFLTQLNILQSIFNGYYFI